MLTRIEGSLINLRKPKPSDVDDIHSSIRHRDMSRFTFIPQPYRREDAEEFIKFSDRAWRKKTGFNFGIEHPESGRIIGGISFKTISYQHKNAEIGYWLGKPFWGRGYMTEAVRMILRIAFVELRLRRVYACVLPGNPASSIVLIKAGFKLEGCHRDSAFLHNRWHDCHIYGILRKEWQKKS